MKYLKNNSVSVDSFYILQHNKLCAWNIHLHLKRLLRLWHKKNFKGKFKSKFKNRPTFIHVAVSKVLMLCDFPQFYGGNEWIIQEEYSFLIFKRLQFTTCSTLMTMNNWTRGASIVALRGPQYIGTHLTVKCYPLPSFESRGAGYESVYYGINNTRPSESKGAHWGYWCQSGQYWTRYSYL